MQIDARMCEIAERAPSNKIGQNPAKKTAGFFIIVETVRIRHRAQTDLR